MKRMVTFPQSTPIMILGGRYGPVNTPHMRDDNEIKSFIKQNVTVHTKLDDGDSVDLIVEDEKVTYRKKTNPNIPIEHPPPENIKPDDKPIEIELPDIDEPIEVEVPVPNEPPKEEPVVEEPITTPSEPTPILDANVSLGQGSVVNVDLNLGIIKVGIKL